MLIDASYLNKVSKDLLQHFSQVIGRELPGAELADLLEYMALDAGIQVGGNEIQVLFVYDGSLQRFQVLKPSGLSDELDGKAFKGKLGEFSLYAYQPSGMATREELFMESLGLMADSKEARHIIALPDEELYGERAAELLEKVEKKENIVLMGMNPPVTEYSHRFEMVGFALLQAFGVRPDELQ